MIARVIVMDAVEEVQALDSVLITCQRPESALDRFLEVIYDKLRDRSDAPILLEEYLDELLYKDLNGEIIAPKLRRLFEACYHQLLDSKIYPANGRLQYAYDSRMGYRTIILTYAD